MATQSYQLIVKPHWGIAYAWLGIGIMWAFWVCFALFLASPGKLLGHWPFPTVDHGGFVGSPWLAAAINIVLISLFGLQHSVMARPWFKVRVMSALPEPFIRCTYVHTANLCLFTLIIL